MAVDGYGAGDVMARPGERPLVSVVIPTYRDEKYVREAVESALTQTHRPLEVVVLDSNDNENTWNELRDVANRIVYARAPARGIAAGRNDGIARASGELIALLDSDDSWMPTKIEEQVEALGAHPEAGLCCTDTEVYDESGVLLESMIPYVDRLFPAGLAAGTRGILAGYLYDELLRQGFVHASTVLIPRRVLKEVGGFDERNPICDDYDRWLAIAQRYPIVVVNKVLTRYRVRRDSVSGGTWGDHVALWESEVAATRLSHLRQLREGQLQGSLQADPQLWPALARYYWYALACDRWEEARLLFRPCLGHQREPVKAILYFLTSYLPAPLIALFHSFRRATVG